MQSGRREHCTAGTGYKKVEARRRHDLVDIECGYLRFVVHPSWTGSVLLTG
jgi:hypothetical protein